MDKMPTVQLGDYTLQIEIEELTPEVQEIARKELRETPDLQKQAVAELRELLKGMAEIFLKLTESNMFVFQRKKTYMYL